MRKSLALLSLSLALAIPAASHASTVFTFTPDGGSPINFGNVPGIAIVGNDTTIETSTPTTSLNVSFFNSSILPYYAQIGYGNFDLLFNYENFATGLSVDSLLDGPQLYDGIENNHPHFFDGTYVLTADPTNPDQPGGTLVISSAPEPSSLVLLGTGAFTAAAAMRRRLRKA